MSKRRLAIDKLLLLALSAFVALTCASIEAHAATSGRKRPSWFPKVSCREAWGNRDLAQYDFERDTVRAPGKGNVGYRNYKERVEKTTQIRRSSCYKDWTILVYMAADNDLAPYALWDLAEMEGGFQSGRYAGSTLKSDLLVQHDPAGADSVRRLHLFQAPGAYSAAPSKEPFVNASLDTVKSPVVGVFKKNGSLSAREHEAHLQSFLEWGMREYPADHYFVVVWGHGQGWAGSPAPPSTTDSRFIDVKEAPISFEDWAPTQAPTGSNNPFAPRFGGLVFSSAPGDYLSIPSLSRILADVKAEVLEGVTEIDMYAADACLMQMVEVAYEISGSVRFINGSSQIHSYLGLPYRQLMYEINSGRFLGLKAQLQTDDEPYLVARMLPELQRRSLDPRRGHQGRADREAERTLTMASLSSADLRLRLVPALRKLGRALLAYENEDPMRRMDLQWIVANTPSFMGGSREIGSFLGLIEFQLKKESASLGRETGAMSALRAVLLETRNALNMTVVSHVFGSGYRAIANPLHLLGFRAVGIWMPTNASELDTRMNDFNASRFYGAGLDTGADWSAWINGLFKK